jgi:hypothetical protein
MPLPQLLAAPWLYGLPVGPLALTAVAVWFGMSLMMILFFYYHCESVEAGSGSSEDSIVFSLGKICLMRYGFGTACLMGYVY